MTGKFQKVISADSHVMEPRDLWWKALGQTHGELTPRTVDHDNGQPGKFFYTGRQTLELSGRDKQQKRIGAGDSGYNPDSRLRFQEEASVDAEVLIATVMLAIMHTPHLNVLKDCTRVYNDWLHEFCSRDPKRLVGAGVIPMNDVEWALSELERTAKMGFKGAVINLMPPEGCPPYRDPHYDPFWARVQEMDTPLMLHVVTGRVPNPVHFRGPAAREEAAGGMMHLFTEIYDVLLNDFIFGTILDRFPRLKVVCIEFEVAWVPHVMWRADQLQTAFAHRFDFPALALEKASNYFRDRIFHVIIDDPYAVEAIPHIGTGQVMWGSDFPHTIALGRDAVDQVEAAFATFPPADQAKIVADNAARVYNL